MKNLFKLYIVLVILLSSVYPVFATVLTWDASAGTVTGYRIYYGTSSGAYSGMEETGNVTQYSLSNLPLLVKTTYYFVVKAYNSAGESEPSNEVSYYCPDTTPPVPPQGLSRQISGSSVILSWTANTETDLAGYNVYQGTSAGAYGTPNTLGKVITSTVSGLTQGRTYYFAVSARDNASNESGYSSAVSASIPDATAPTVAISSPTTSATYSTTTSSVALSGTASDNVGVTRVTWANAANSTSGTATGTTSWSVSSVSLASGTNNITITATDSAGNTYTNTLTVTYSPPKTISAADTTSPVVVIKRPTSYATYRTRSASIKMTGTATDNVGATKVTWANTSNGTNGTATGTASWTIDKITLKIGTNTIIITAYDAAGNASTDTLSVTRRR
jgi:hypothetical protein